MPSLSLTINKMNSGTLLIARFGFFFFFLTNLMNFIDVVLMGISSVLELYKKLSVFERLVGDEKQKFFFSLK